MWAFIQKKIVAIIFHTQTHILDRFIVTPLESTYVVGFIHILFDSIQCKAKQESKLGG